LCSLLPLSYLFPLRPKHHSHTPLSNVSPSLWETTFHSHVKNRLSYSSVYFSLCFWTADWTSKHA
jgi:hypothetical protein